MQYWGMFPLNTTPNKHVAIAIVSKIFIVDTEGIFAR